MRNSPSNTYLSLEGLEFSLLFLLVCSNLSGSVSLSSLQTLSAVSTGALNNFMSFSLGLNATMLEQQQPDNNRH
jgi:hypothetical protein